MLTAVVLPIGEKGNQNEKSIQLAVNDIKKEIVIAELKMNKDRIKYDGLKEKAKRLKVVEYPKYNEIQYLGLGVENIGDYLKH